MLLQIGTNSKLGKSIGAVSLPAESTCPGKTLYCAKVCYAKKGFFRFPKINRSLQDNYEFSLTEDFVPFINAKLKKAKIKALRIHPSGDFYSLEYIDKWIAIAKANPTIKFWAYTRSWRIPEMIPKLKELSEQKNLVLFASTDETTKEHPPSWIRIAHVAKTWENVHHSFVQCPNQKNENITCDKCTFCFKHTANIKQHVIFKEH